MCIDVMAGKKAQQARQKMMVQKTSRHPLSSEFSAEQELAALLREGRMRRGLTQAEVAEKLGLRSAQSVSDWERGRVTSAPVQSLLRLIELYALEEEQVFAALFRAEAAVLERKLKEEFYGQKRKSNR